MAGLIRSRQAGIQNDLSAGLNSDLFMLDDLGRFGVNSQISALAYNPVQSLLAIGTRSTQFGPGQICVFGQKRVCVSLNLPPRGTSVLTLQFCANKLICLDSKHDITVFSLETKKLLASHSPPGVVTTICTDPLLDYALIGMQTGDIFAYDIDREAITSFKIPNLWTEVEPRARAASIVCLQFHPKDIGTLLIGYAHGATIYSFKANRAIRHFRYEIPAGAPGGDGISTTRDTIRRPRLTQATWHPSGTFIMTGHEDSSLVFWDVLKDGRMLCARTRTDVGIARPGSTTIQNPHEAMAGREPIFQMAWCANGQNPDDTGVLIAGGASEQAVSKGLCFLELGPTPIYATSNWEALAAHFDNPKRQRILPTPLGAEVINFCLVPRTSPHFNGAHDPIAVIALLSSGELLTLSFPSGMPISPTNQLHAGLTFVHPFIQHLNATAMDRARWLGMVETRQQGPLIVKGGKEAALPMRRYEKRNIIHTAHADGTVRLWDIGHGDEIENDRVMQVDVGRAVGRPDRIEITQTSLSGESGELAVGTRSGEVIAFRWGRNRNAGRDPPPTETNRPGQLVDVSNRVEAALSEGLLPLTLLDKQNGPVTAVKISDVGFIAASWEGGDIAVIDLRGPAIILDNSLQEYMRAERHGSMRRRAGSTTAQAEWAVRMEFSVMTLEGEQWSSILLHVGTNLGHVATFKIIPDPSGRYSVQYIGAVTLESKIIHIHPVNVDSGTSASASQHAVAALRSGAHTNGALIVATATSLHVFRPATAKGAHKSFDNVFCDSAGVVRFQDQSHAIIALCGDGTARAFSIPALKEIATVKLDKLDVRRFPDAIITSAGNIIAFTGPSEVALLSIFGAGERLHRDQDILINPAAMMPPRPTIGAVAWVTGTQYVTPADMDTLIGGPGRPPSKRMIAQMRAEEAQQRANTGSGAGSAYGGSNATATPQDETYWAYMQRQVTERTEKLSFVNDTMDSLQQSSSDWLKDVNKFVGQQKRNAATGIIKAKFGI